MNPLKKLASQTAIYGLPTILGRFLNYLLVPLYTRVFLPEEYGIVTEMYAYVSFLFVLLTYGMETAFFRYANQEDHSGKVFGTAMSALIATSAIFLFLTYGSASYLAGKLGYSDHPEYVRWFALILVADVISTIPYANLRLGNKAIRFAAVKFVNILSNIGFNLFFIVACPYIFLHFPGSTLAGFISKIYAEDIGVGYIFISNLLASLLTLGLLLPEISFRNLKPDKKLLRKMLAYGWPLLIFGMAGIVNETFDRIILKHLITDKSAAMVQLGIYGACYKVSILMTLFIQTYRYAAEPFFFDQAAKKDARKTYATTMHYFIIICLFIFLAIMMYIDYVMHFVGKSYREGVQVVPVLLLANMCLGIFYNLSVWFKLTDKTKTGALISIAGAMVTVVLNFLLIPLMGYMGAAWATLACYAFMMLLSYVVGQKYYHIDYNLKSALKYLAAALLIYYISSLELMDTSLYKVLLNTIMLLLFMVFVYSSEKQRFKTEVNKGF